MTEARFDFAIVGSTPLARLVAGLLASAHGKRVLFAGDSRAHYRLTQGVDLSVAPLTRPESWSLLKAVLPETRKLITRIAGRSVWSRVDPIFFADEPAGKEALAHIRHMALAFGHGAEPVPGSAIGDGRDGLLLRDAVLLHRPMLEPALDAWLVRHKVRRLGEHETIVVHADGSGELVSGDVRTGIGQTVLADDAAIIRHVPMAQWPALLRRQVTSTIFTEPTRPIVAPVMQQIDNGAMLVQRPDRGITAIGPGAIGEFAATLSILLGHDGDFRQAGQSGYETLVTSDAAPAVGRVNGNGPDVLAGFGQTGAFLAPPIARWLSGTAGPLESAWLGARLVDRQISSSAVAEIGAVP